MINEELRKAAYGFILGDALGVPFEFKKRGTFECAGMEGYGTHDQPPGTWSDDSSMMLATCRSLKENDLSIDIDNMREKFISWLNEGEYTPFGETFDMGIATSTALDTGKPQDDEYSNGNGSLMRILPLAFVDCTDEEIRQVSAITHAHEISKQACVIYVDIIKEYLRQNCSSEDEKGSCDSKRGKSMAEIIREIPEYKPPFDRLCRLDELSEDEIRSSGYVVDTLEAALWCILRTDEEPDDRGKYTRCLIRAVNLGDDTDTVAAVTGGLAGLIWPIEQIPKDWIEKIKAKDLIEECLF